jgi:DNA-binding transcriptional regulator YdaS (Cro superfamily)
MPNNLGMKQISPIEKAIQIVGGLTALARLVGVAPPTVHEWKTGKRPVPIERCLAIERATSGAVTRLDLRPDDYLDIWPELAEAQAAPAQAAIKTVENNANSAIEQLEKRAEEKLQHIAEEAEASIRRVAQEVRPAGATKSGEPDEGLPPIEFEESLPPIAFPDGPPAAADEPLPDDEASGE